MWKVITMVVIILTVLLVFLGVLGICAIKHSNDYISNTDSSVGECLYNKEPGDVLEYHLSVAEFQDFMRAPAVEKLSNYSPIVYRDSENGGLQRRNTKEENYFIAFERNEVRIGGWVVDSEFLEYMRNKKNFEEALSEKGVEEEVLDWAIITHPYRKFYLFNPPPGTAPIMCIWLHTDENDYFLEGNAQLLVNDPYAVFTYDFYTRNEYATKYNVK